MMRIAITGATGYIGQRLIYGAHRAGHEVLALSRSSITQRGVAWQPFDLAEVVPVSLPSDVAALFHLAAETRHPQGDEQNELASAQHLIEAAAVVGAVFVFVSSQTARADAPTAYGRIKWQIERMTLTAGGVVVRPGLVYGGEELGLFGVLCNLVRRLPILPAFIPAPVVQPVHVDDLAEALLACRAQAPSSILCVAGPTGVNFTEFLQAIAYGRVGRRRVYIPIPVLFVSAIAVLLGPRQSSRLGLDRLGSLFSLPYMGTQGDLRRLSLTLRPLCDGVTRSGRGRRELLTEGRVMLIYVLRMAPVGGLLRRYVRAIESLRMGRPLPLPTWVRCMPALLALLDGAGSIDAEFKVELAWRLNASLMLAEASPQGARRFLGADQPAGFLRSGMLMARAVLMEFACRVAQLMLRPMLCRVGRRSAFE